MERKREKKSGAEDGESESLVFQTWKSRGGQQIVGGYKEWQSFPIIPLTTHFIQSPLYLSISCPTWTFFCPDMHVSMGLILQYVSGPKEWKISPHSSLL